jgi:Tol biopolymer transport system component
MSEERVRAALREIADAAPVHPDVRATMKAAPAEQPSWRSRPWFAPGLAAAAVILVIVAVILVRLPSGSPEPPGDGGGPTLPDRFPAFSFLQGASDGRFGRAIALYTNGTGHEDWGFWQLILADSDSDRYRRLNVPSNPIGGLVATRLSPDGTLVAIGGTGITVLDITTGGTNRFPITASAGAGVVPLAFSPDGTHIAYTTPLEVGGTGPLSILDIADGASTPVAGGHIRAAAFSPDGTRLAFQIGYPPAEEISISRLDGTLATRITIPPKTELAGPQAWSPDGRYLVGMKRDPDRQGDEPSYVFLDATAAGVAVPAPISAQDLTPRSWGDAVLGWQSPTRMLVSTGDVDGTTSNLIIAVDITTGSRQIVSRFAVGAHDDLAVGDVQLATALLGTARVRHSTHPDRGPWPVWAIGTSAVCVILFALAAVLRRIRRRTAG